MSSSANSLDYTPLNQPVSQADIATYDKYVKSLNQKSVAGFNSSLGIVILVGVGVYALVVVAVIAGQLVESIRTGNMAGLLSVGLAGLIVGVLMAYMALTMRRRQKYLAKLYKFALKNKLQLLADRQPNSSKYPGIIFDEGHSRLVVDALIFPEVGEIGNFRYITGNGKNQQTHRWTYVRIKLTRRLPNMVLDARANNFFGRLSNLPDSFNKGQTLELEGDFNKHFKLYAPKEYERDALYVFTPDVMAAVIDAGKNYDMEVVDDNLLLYSRSTIDLTSEKQLRTLLGAIDRIAAELKHQTKRYADERVDGREINIVAEKGRRLKRGISLSAVALIIIFIVYIVSIIASM